MTRPMCQWCLGHFQHDANYIQVKDINGYTVTVCQGCWESQLPRIADALGLTNPKRPAKVVR